jgi:hypothetical protein
MFMELSRYEAIWLPDDTFGAAVKSRLHAGAAFGAEKRFL